MIEEGLVVEVGESNAMVAAIIVNSVGITNITWEGYKGRIIREDIEDIT